MTMPDQLVYNDLKAGGRGRPMTNLQKIGEPEQLEQHASGAGELSPLQEHFLARLEALAVQREAVLKNEPVDKDNLKLLSRALYATYMDCVGSDVADQGNAIMERAQAGVS